MFVCPFPSLRGHRGIKKSLKSSRRFSLFGLTFSYWSTERSSHPNSLSLSLYPLLSLLFHSLSSSFFLPLLFLPSNNWIHKKSPHIHLGNQCLLNSFVYFSSYKFSQTKIFIVKYIRLNFFPWFFFPSEVLFSNSSELILESNCCLFKLLWMWKFCRDQKVMLCIYPLLMFPKVAAIQLQVFFFPPR